MRVRSSAGISSAYGSLRRLVDVIGVDDQASVNSREAPEAAEHERPSRLPLQHELLGDKVHSVGKRGHHADVRRANRRHDLGG